MSMVEGESNRLLFKEFVTTFYFMKNGIGDLETLLRAFEIKLLTLTGYGINTEYCVKCGKKIANSNYFSYSSYGGVCNECKKEKGKTVTFATFKALNYLSKIQLDKVYRVKLSGEVKLEIYEILAHIIEQSYGKKANSLEIFNSLKRSD
jgi:DNA repair protein RecO (recombination protein O)